MKLLVVVTFILFGVALVRPSDIIDFELDHMEHEQEGQAGRAVEGEYSWVAPDGEEYMVKYKADHLGYRVVDSNVVPETHNVKDEDTDEDPDEAPRLRAAELEEDSEEEDE
ncbi:uncharacterized protein LOC143017532 [Oratosquilla oratoria]|uniref:uncharacterized protein LOC143017532 n=1 Tax=Oratosquilla oratoria TaxID=337810 RepID=UPI003F75A7AC